MSDKKPYRPWHWFAVFFFLFSAISGGIFLWALGASYNLYWSLGCALVVGGTLFSIFFIIWFITADGEERKA